MTHRLLASFLAALVIALPAQARAPKRASELDYQARVQEGISQSWRAWARGAKVDDEQLRRYAGQAAAAPRAPGSRFPPCC